MDVYGFYKGEVFDAHKFLGAHREGEGYIFRVYAPHANRITLVGEFNDWQDWEMNHCYNEHFWEVYVPQAKAGQRYLYRVWHQDGNYTEHCDPYGFGITLLSMGIVFSCLALLFVFFTLFGIFMKNKKRIREMLGLSRTQKKKIVGLDEEDARAFPNKSLERSKTYDRDIYIAVISMALKQYSDDVHDTESGVITIRPHNSKWHSV